MTDFLLRWLFGRGAWAVITERIGTQEARVALRRTWRTYARLVRQLPREKGFSVRLFLRLAAAVTGLYRALLDAEVAPEAPQRNAPAVASRAGVALAED
ncbi:hypothetical protein ACFL59_03380 [Planctomycetota bacterium]